MSAKRVGTTPGSRDSAQSSWDEVKRVIDGIAGNPLRHSIRSGNWRRANLRRSPHAVFYQLIHDQPVVFAVLHAKRDHAPILETRLPTR